MSKFLESIKDKIFLCADMGSTHKGQLDNAIKLANITKLNGFNSIKCQLGLKEPNIDFCIDDYFQLVDHCHSIGLDISTSIFAHDNPIKREELISIVISTKPKWFKFAYSQKHLVKDQYRFLDAGIDVIVSCDVMTRFVPIPEAIKLFCIPEYPVNYQISFEGIFERFYGFSDHTMGINQPISAAKRMVELLKYPRWIEKHICIDTNDASCPDSYFSINGNEMKMLTDKVRMYENVKKNFK